MEVILPSSSTLVATHLPRSCRSAESMKPSGSTARSRSAAAQSTTSMVCSNTPPSGWNAGFWGTEAHLSSSGKNSFR